MYEETDLLFCRKTNPHNKLQVMPELHRLNADIFTIYSLFFFFFSKSVPHMTLSHEGFVYLIS